MTNAINASDVVTSNVKSMVQAPSEVVRRDLSVEFASQGLVSGLVMSSVNRLWHCSDLLNFTTHFFFFQVFKRGHREGKHQGSGCHSDAYGRIFGPYTKTTLTVWRVKLCTQNIILHFKHKKCS